MKRELMSYEVPQMNCGQFDDRKKRKRRMGINNKYK